MSSLLTIANKALRKLGVAEINSLTQQGRAADRCNSAVVNIVKEVLREHPWSHAVVWTTLPLLSETPTFGYTYAYQLPVEALKLVDVRDDTDLRAKLIDFAQVRGKKVYTDASPCYARYVVYVEADLAQAAPDFIEACAWRLAEEVASPLAKTDLMSGMHQGYMLALDRARLNDTAGQREREVDPNRQCTFLSARGFPYTEDEDQWP